MAQQVLSPGDAAGTEDRQGRDGAETRISHEPFSNGLLFHEFVHVEQYRQVRIPRFSELYVRGFLNGGSYEAIPLEVNAYTLGGRFEQNPANRFSVANEVGRWIAEGRF